MLLHQSRGELGLVATVDRGQHQQQTAVPTFCGGRSTSSTPPFPLFSCSISPVQQLGPQASSSWAGRSSPEHDAKKCSPPQAEGFTPFQPAHPMWQPTVIAFQDSSLEGHYVIVIMSAAEERREGEVSATVSRQQVTKVRRVVTGDSLGRIKPTPTACPATSTTLPAVPLSLHPTNTPPQPATHTHTRAMMLSLARAPLRAAAAASSSGPRRPAAAAAAAAVPSSRGALRVVAFREDERPNRGRRANADTSIAQDLKRGGQRVQAKGSQLASKGRSVATKNAKQAGRGFGSGDFEGAVENNASAYGINTVALATAAGAAAYSPGLVVSIFFQPAFLTSADSAGAGLLVPLLQLLALGLSGAAVTNWVQAGAAQLDMLDAPLHRRLNASLSTFSVAQLALLGLALTPLSKSILMGFPGSAVLNTSGVLALSLGVLAQLYVAGVNYAKNSPEGYSPVADAKSWLQDAANSFSGINGSFSAGYAVLTASLLAAGIGYLVAPGPTLQGVFGGSAPVGGGPDAILLWQLVGAGVSMVIAPMAYSLKEFAAAASLSDMRAKTLNIALLTAGLGHWLVLYPRLGGDASVSGPLLPVVLGTWGLAALLGSVNLLQGREKDEY